MADREENAGELKRRLPGARVLRRTRIRKLLALPRVLGVAALFSTAYGNVGSSIYYALGVTALFALGLTPAVFLVAGIIFGFTALTYAEGTAAIPEAGGSSSFARHGFNELVSFIAAWALLLGYIVTIAISAFSVSNYFGVFWPLWLQFPWNTFGGILVVAFLMWVNVIGVKETARLNIGLAILDLATQIVLVIVGTIFLLNWRTLLSNIEWGVAPTWGHALYGLSFAMVAYTGIETISNMAEETANPEKTIPKSVSLVFLAVLIVYTGISLIALSAMPIIAENGTYTTELTTKYLKDPVVGIAHKLPIPALSRIMELWIGALAVTILVIATNAGLIGVSRLTFSMGIHQQLPPGLSKIHRRFKTPYISILLFGFIAILLILPGKIDFLAEMYVFGAVLAFAMAHVSIIAMRIRKPDLPRPFKIPLNFRFRGAEIPVTAVLGAIGTIATWSIVVYTRPTGRWVGFAWLIIGMVVYILYRRAKGLPLKKTVRTETRP